MDELHLEAAQSAQLLLLSRLLSLQAFNLGVLVLFYVALPHFVEF